MARFRHTDEVAKSKTTATLAWTSWGERLRGGSPYGDFLVNFLCKENWNVGASEMLSKKGYVQIKINVFSSSACFVPKQPPSPLGKAKNGRAKLAPTDRGWAYTLKDYPKYPFFAHIMSEPVVREVASASCNGGGISSS